MPSSSSPFHEVQRFPLRRTAAALSVPPLAMLLLTIWQVILGHDMGQYAMPNKSLVGWTVFLWVLFFRLITVSLVTSVRDGQLVITLRGLWRARRLPLSEIKSVEIITFEAKRDYGGSGIRSIPNGTAYLGKGEKGVRLSLKNGASIVMSSERPEELAKALR
jgi:hypothetical protein